MIPKRAFWFAVGAAAGVVGARRAESELQARREQLTPANLARGAAGKLTSAAAGAPGKVGGAVKGRVKARSAGPAGAQPWDERDWSGAQRR